MAKIELNVIQALSQAIDSVRPCDGCTACCYVFGIKELGKPYYQHCEHQGLGCRIHHKRPTSCRSFECVWRMPFMGNDVVRRPDKLGLIFSVDEDSHGEWLEVYEVRKDALDDALNGNGVPELIEEMFEKIGGLRGIRVYRYGDKVTTSYPINKRYRDDGVSFKERTYLTQDGIRHIYLSQQNLDGPTAEER